jgi:predicted phosphodiesterase
MKRSSSMNFVCQQLFFFFIPLIAFLSCTIKQPMSSLYEIAPSKPRGPSISRTVMLVADNQLNHLYGDPMWMRSSFVDKIVPVAVRPVQQDLFGQDILRWVMQYYGARWPVIHLGDGTNMACSGELESFIQIMSTATKPWVMAPGNHDTFLFGNSSINHAEWEAACQRADGPTTKDRFIRRYLLELQRQFNGFRDKYRGTLPDSGEYRATEGSHDLLRSVAWQIDRQEPWRSFIVQELNLTMRTSPLSIFAILLDSTQYSTEPTLIPSSNAGVSGDIQPDQLDVVRQWMQADAENENLTLLMSHHPFGTLKEIAKKSINALRQLYHIPLYISGHTHEGQYFARGGNNGWLELNVGSIVDWPIEFRSLTLNSVRNDPKKLFFVSELYRLPELWDELLPPQAPQCDGSWEIKPQQRDYYLEYARHSTVSAEETQEDLMDSLLTTYKRYLSVARSSSTNKIWPECCSSDETVQQEINRALENYDLQGKVSLLIELDKFDRNREAADPVLRRNYRICQAVWASKYEKHGTNWPIPSDLYIVFPRR